MRGGRAGRGPGGRGKDEERTLLSKSRTDMAKIKMRSKPIVMRVVKLLDEAEEAEAEEGKGEGRIE